MEPAVLWAAIAAAIIGGIYLYFKWRLNYWKRRGLKTYDKFSIHINLRILLHEAYTNLRSRHLKHGGINLLLRSFYLPMDLDIIKSICVKNFDHFPNHQTYVNEEADPLSGHLFNLRDDKWRNLRTKLTPIFTTGKLKMMFQTMADCTPSMVDLLRETSSSPVDIKEIVGRFTTDIIGSVAFGIECNAMKDPDSDFRNYGKQAFTATWRTDTANIVPENILKAIGFRITKDRLEEFFINVIRKVVNYRESKNIYRKDFMHMMLQLKNRGQTVDDGKIMDDNKKGNYMTVLELAAQSYVFFIAGFETSSSLMTFTLLELSQHTDIQDKVREEMTRIIKKHGGLTYDAIMSMQYLDQVVHESLRKYPPVFLTNRSCVKDFHIPDSNVLIEKGTNIMIPVYDIHHDPEYYPDPEKFDPDRFSPENKASRHSCTFLTFGEGPRICIGARFGLLQAKVGLTAILSNFKVTLNNKTKMPIEFSNGAFPVLAVKDDVWLNCERVEV